MKISSISDLKLVAIQAMQMRDEVADILGAADKAELRLAMPSAPVPLTLKALAQWRDTANDVLRQPKVAAGKRQLERRGIETTAIPLTVLEQPGALATVLSALDAVPPELASKVKSEIAAALTKGLDDARSVAATIEKLKSLLKPLERQRESHPDVVSSAYAHICAGATDVEATVSLATKVISTKAELGTLGLRIELKGKSLTESAQSLSHLRSRISQCSQTASAEGLKSDERPDVHGKTMEEAERAADEFLLNVENEKQRHQQECANLAAKLGKLGIASPQLPNTVGLLRIQQAELQGRLKQRQRDLTRALGKGATDFLASLAEQKVPDTLSDADMGRMLRKALECGYTVKLEHPHEDQ